MQNENNSSRSLLFFLGSLIFSFGIGFITWKIMKGKDANNPSAIAEISAEMPVKLTISGSNTIGDKLMPEIAKAYMVKQGFSATTIQLLKKEDYTYIVGEKNGQKSAILVHAQGTSEAFKDLQIDKSDIGMASRPINDAEVQALSAKGNMRSTNCEHVLAMDGIAVIVAPNNPIKNLTKQQLASIFSGNINNWSQITDSKAGSIQLYIRDENSGTYESFKSVVMNGGTIAGQAKVFKNGQELSAAVTNDPNGIGFVALPAVGNNKSLAIAADEGITPFYPNALTIATEDYALSRRLFLYTPATIAKEEAKSFLDFALSDEAAKIISQNGLIGLDLKASADASRSANNFAQIPEAYKKATNGAARENFNIHFLSGSAQVDNKAYEDLRKLSNLFATSQYRNKQILLLGFTDDQGDNATNEKLGLARAKSVAESIKSYGISQVQTFGMGEIMPIASNKTPEGKEKNRRVEVWLK